MCSVNASSFERRSPIFVKYGRTIGVKVAILGTRGIPARYGGFETFAEMLATGLVARGFEVTVFCEAGGSLAFDTFQGVKLRYISAPALGSLQTVLYDMRCLWAARKGYDVVYMLGYGAAPFCLIPRLWKTEVWINPDGLEWARAKWGILAKSYFRLMEWTSIYASNRIIADAEAIASSLASRHGRLRACTVIPYGCEAIEMQPAAELLAAYSLVSQGYYLVVCRLEPENHVLEILQAFERSGSDRELIVVGDHFTGTRYVALLRAVQSPRIRMIGTVYDQAMLTSLRYHSFAYLHGHCVGGTNPSLLEAMGCGNLIFAHDNPFNRETLGPCGFYFANSLELTQAIDLAEQEEAELERLRGASKARARANYGWTEVISKYVALLERTANGPGKG
jgi:glycosyltransferase involved in cell wall biosynthesis